MKPIEICFATGKNAQSYVRWLQQHKTFIVTVSIIGECTSMHRTLQETDNVGKLLTQGFIMFAALTSQISSDEVAKGKATVYLQRPF